MPYVDMNRIASEERAEAVVIGSHGKTWLKEVWLGSVASAILHHSSVPVLVIKIRRLLSLPPEECADFCGGLFGRVLFPTDFSDPAEVAFCAVTRCAERTRSQVHLVHIQEVSRIRPHLEHMLEQFNRIDTARLERLGESLQKAGAREVTHEIRVDHPVKGIVSAIERWRPDLVVLGSHGRSRFAEALLGSTALQVARMSPAPVLVVPWRRC